MLIGRHSFIRQSKLSDVAGRIDYISNPKRQEYLYATYQTEGATPEFWKNLAKENRLVMKAISSRKRMNGLRTKPLPKKPRINRYVKEETEKLSVFHQGGVYLATKKIGKNNPKVEEIKADNAARQEWNRTVDVALIEGVSEEDILKIKREKITDKTLQSIRTHGWLPDMFRQIIRGAKDFLQEVIFKFKLPPKPVPKIDLQEWKDMQKLMYELQRQSMEIKRTQQDIFSLKKFLL